MKLKPVQSEWRARLNEVRKFLAGVPNVIGVGIGLRERAGASVAETVWRVYVRRKLSRMALPPGALIPPSILGLATDVIAALPSYAAAASKTYAPGMPITTPANDPGALGCFARTSGSPGANVLLSCAHVLFANLTTNQNVEIYQPKYGSCCGGGDLIATTLNTWVDGFKSAGGGAFETDCAIAKLGPNVKFTNEIPQIGMIKGVQFAPLPGPAQFGVPPKNKEVVRMLSSERQAVQFGTILRPNVGSTTDFLLHSALSDPSDAAKDTRPHVNQLVIVPRLPPRAGDAAGPDDALTTEEYVRRYQEFLASGQRLSFAIGGDSGGVVVNSNNEVIGLVCRQFPTSTLPPSADQTKDELRAASQLGVVTPIKAVLDLMKITIPPNFSGTGPSAGTVVRVFMPGGANGPGEPTDAGIDQLTAELSKTRMGCVIMAKIDRHRDEVRMLVNRVRHATVAWHRNQGPAFVQHCIKNVRDPSHVIPNAINGVDQVRLLDTMADTLIGYSSEKLRRDISRYRAFVLTRVAGSSSLHDLPAILKRRPLALKKVRP